MKIKKIKKREGDRFWLLIYQLWDESELRDNGQGFLADLKKNDFKFLDLEVYEPEEEELLETENTDD